MSHPKGNPRLDLPTGTSPCQPLTQVFPAAPCPGPCPGGLPAGMQAALPTRARLAPQPRPGNPVSRGTGLEHGGKQGIAQPAPHS